MSSARPRWLLALVAAAALVAACSADSGKPASEALTCPDGRQVTPPSGPDALPVEELSVLGEERTVSTACLLGTPLVVNFWAEWCGPCRREMPALEAVHQSLGDQVRFVGIDYDDQEQAAIEFAEEVGVTYELLEDPEGSYFRATEGRGAPYTLLVDAEGTIVHRHHGEVTESGLTDLLGEHLGVESNS